MLEVSLVLYSGVFAVILTYSPLEAYAEDIFVADRLLDAKHAARKNMATTIMPSMLVSMIKKYLMYNEILLVCIFLFAKLNFWRCSFFSL